MMRRLAPTINLTEKQKKILEDLRNGTHTPLHLIKRAGIVLLAYEGYSNYAIERELRLNTDMVRLWCNRASESLPILNKIEDETPHKLKSAIIDMLTDAQRPGAPCKFSDDIVAQIIALACCEPDKIGLPFSHWTPQLLQVEVIKRNIVSSISVRQIGRFLKRSRSEASFN